MSGGVSPTFPIEVELMSNLSGRGVADNVRTVRHLLRIARRVHSNDQRAPLLREARLVLDHARAFYATQAEVIVDEVMAVVRTLLEPARAGLDVLDGELRDLERDLVRSRRGEA